MNVRLTIRELVSFGRFPHSRGRLTAEDLRIVDQAMEYMELMEMQHDYLDELSGGQRQRAFIAMVIAQDTDYILLDEPLNNLDMKHSVQIMKILRRLVDDLGKTVVIVLHDINFASVYSDRIVALKEGRVVKDGPTDEIINSDALKEIYDMDIPIKQMAIAVYVCISTLKTKRMVMMKKITMTLMMFALMALLVACGTEDEKTTEKTTGATD